MLSVNEYCVLDSIHKLQNNEDHMGWCYKSKQNMANDLDLSKRTIITIISTLIKKGLVVKNETTNHLRCTNVFNELLINRNDWIIANKNIGLISGVVSGEDSAPTVQNTHNGGAKISQKLVKKVPNNGEKTAHYNNSIKTVNKNIDTEAIFFSENEIQAPEEKVEIINPVTEQEYDFDNDPEYLKLTSDWSKSTYRNKKLNIKKFDPYA